MSKPLPENASLEHLKSQAKSLLLSLRNGDAEALAQFTKLALTEPFKLAQAQLVVARDYGFDSWSKLKRHVEGFPSQRAEFFAAIRAGDRLRVAALLSKAPELARSNDPDDFGSTPITQAANRNDLPMIDLLLQHGADLNAKSTWWAGGFGPLDFADEATSDALIQRGAKITAHAAARLGRADALKSILKDDPQAVHQRGGDGQFPLHFAKTPEVVDILVGAGADLDARDLDHHGTAAQFRIHEIPVLERLVYHGATQDVFTAVMLQDLETLAALLDADPDALRRRTGDPGNPWIPEAPGAHAYIYSIANVRPHQVASHFERHEAYRLLWDRSDASLRLSMAGWAGDAEAAGELLRLHPDLAKSLTREDHALLASAAWVRKLDSVRLMLELGFDPNVPGDEDSTPIDRAAFHGFDDIIEAILPYGPDLALRNVYGGTPLGACMYGSVHGWRKDGNYPRSVRLLLEAGSQVPSQVGGSAEVRAVLAEFGIG